MPASLLTLPCELREQILLPVLQEEGTIGLQYPLWANKTVFVSPITQVCKPLREEAIQLFYRANVFMWLIDPEAVRPSGALMDPVDPGAFPLEPRRGSLKDFGPTGPLVSSLPWQYPLMKENLRRLRLNLYLPPQYNTSLWTGKFGKQLSAFVEAVDQGRRLDDFKVLIATWHGIRNLDSEQMAVVGILEAMEARGRVQVRTRSLDAHGKALVRSLDLERRMKANVSLTERVEKATAANGQHLDWEWEGGAIV